MKRFLSVILAIAMCLSFVGSAFAATTGDTTEIVYSFLPKEYGTVGSEDYVNIKGGAVTSTTGGYSDSGKHWKYFTMDGDSKTYSDVSSNNAKKVSNIVTPFGLKFTARNADNFEKQWLAIKLRVPEPGLYDISYLKGVDTTYASNASLYMIPADHITAEDKAITEITNAITSNNKYLIDSGINCTTGTGVSQSAGQLTATSYYHEFILVLRPNAKVISMALQEVKLTKVSDVPTKKVYITAPAGVTLTGVTNATQGSQIDVVVGETVTATAPATVGDKTFKYWKDLSSGSVYSTDAKVSFTLASNTSLMAVYAEKPDGKFLVEFANANREILMSEYLATGDAITAPALPSLTGYGVAKEWSAYPEVVADADVQSIAQYDAPKAVSITVTGGTADKDSYTYNDKVTVTAADTGSFVCWERDGKVVSYNPTYSFYAWSDATLTAVTEGNTSSAPSVILDSDVRNEGGADAYMMELVNTENYTVLEYGILFGGSDLDLTKDTVYKASAVTKSSTQFSAMVPDVNGIEAVRAYVVYKDGLNIKTIYSDTVSK